MIKNLNLVPAFKKNKVYLLIFIFFFFYFSQVNAATLSISPKTGVYTVGGVFSTQIRLNTQGKPVNAAEGQLQFDPNKITVLSVKKGPTFNLWTAEPSFSNSAGTVSFSGGSPTGYKGASGAILSITFKVKTAGETNVKFKSGSILAADGLGTNILTAMSSGAFTLVANTVPAKPEVIEYVAPANTPAAPKVTSVTHPDKTKWYSKTTAELAWKLPSDAISVRTLLNDSSGSIPTKVYDKPIAKLTIPDLDEGVQYFHIQFKNSEGWGRVAHYRLAVDTQKPTKFEISLPQNADVTIPEQILLLTTEDEPSGIAKYTVQIDGGDPYEYIDKTASGTITLPALEPGHHSVIMEAYDKAGNSLISTFSFDILAFDKPKFTEYPDQINTQVIPVIKGLTRPNSKVVVDIKQVKGTDSYTSPSQYTVLSDEKGVFIIVPDGRLANGVYELTAVAIDANGAKSDPSDPIRIAVQDPGYIQIGSFIVSILSVIIPLLALLILFVLLIIYFITRVRKIRSFVKTETKEALAVLDREFELLQSELANKKKALEKSRKTKKLTKAESDLIETMKEAMKKSRKKVAKEVSDVDDIIE